VPGEFLKFGDSVVHINYGRRPGRRICKFCGNPYREGRMCDYPIAEGKTCDAAMCAGCSRTLGRQATDIGGGLIRPNDTIDVCPLHRAKVVMKDGKLVPEQASLWS
jgi:hypothetical protein